MPRHHALNLTPLEARDVPAATVQFIHNSPYSTAKVVDIYRDNVLYLDDFTFETATARLTFPSQTAIKIDITASDAKSNANPLATKTLNLADDTDTLAIICGDPSKPTGSTAFALATAPGRSVSASPGEAEAIAFNGSPDLASLDLRVRGAGLLGNDVPFGGFGASYLPYTPTSRSVDLLPGAGGLQLSTSTVNFADYKGQGIVLMASGFRNPAATSDPSLHLTAVLADGSTVIFSGTRETAFAAAAATSTGGSVVLATPRGETVTSITAFPGMKTSPRVALADLDSDGRPEVIIGTGPGVVATVRVLDGETGAVIREIEPFGTFTGGVNVAAGDITGDGVPEYVLSPDDGGGPRVRVYNGLNGNQIADYFGIDDVNFRGGARAAIGDLNSDGHGDLIVGAGLGGGPRIALFDGSKLATNGGPKFAGDFFAFEQDLRNGAFLASGDVNGDGFADLIVGGGPGGGPRVRVFDGIGLTNPTFASNVLADFFAGGDSEREGARIAARDVDYDGRADVIAGGIKGGAASVRIFLARDLPLSGSGTAAVALNGIDGAAAIDNVFVG